MFTMKNGTHSAMQSTSASVKAVEIAIAQLLPVAVDLHVQAAVPARWHYAGLSENVVIQRKSQVS